MSRGRSIAVVALVAVILAAFLSGCGSSPHAPAAKPATTTARTTPAKAPLTEAGSAQQVASDRALGERALLQLSDFPTGWTEEPREKSSNTYERLTRSLASCLHVSVALLLENPAKVESPDFKGVENEKISNSVVFMPTVAAAKERFSAYDQPETASCMTTAASAALQYALQHPASGEKVPASVKVGPVTLARMSFPTYDEQSVAYRLTIPVSASGININIYLDVVAILHGRANAGLQFENESSPVESSLEEHLSALTAERLHK